MAYYSEYDIKNALNGFISATETMNDLDVDYEVIRARLKSVKEIADSLGIDIVVPNRKQTLIQRFFGEGK